MKSAKRRRLYCLTGVVIAFTCEPKQSVWTGCTYPPGESRGDQDDGCGIGASKVILRAWNWLSKTVRRFLSRWSTTNEPRIKIKMGSAQAGTGICGL